MFEENIQPTPSDEGVSPLDVISPTQHDTNQAQPPEEVVPTQAETGYPETDEYDQYTEITRRLEELGKLGLVAPIYGQQKSGPRPFMGIMFSDSGSPDNKKTIYLIPAEGTAAYQVNLATARNPLFRPIYTTTNSQLTALQVAVSRQIWDNDVNTKQVTWKTSVNEPEVGTNALSTLKALIEKRKQEIAAKRKFNNDLLDVTSALNTLQPESN